MSKEWVVLFGGEKVDSSEDFTLNFVPLERLLGNYRSFDVKDFDAFVKKIRTVSYTHLTLPTNREV